MAVGPVCQTELQQFRKGSINKYEWHVVDIGWRQGANEYLVEDDRESAKLKN